MKIYLAHSREFDFRKELYIPIRNSDLNLRHRFILPHEESGEPFSSRKFIATCDLVIAEVSFPSTGMGIELGWANAEAVRIACIHKNGVGISPSLAPVAIRVVSYANATDMVRKIKRVLATLGRRETDEYH